jgi:hypothetical protein
MTLLSNLVKYYDNLNFLRRNFSFEILADLHRSLVVHRSFNKKQFSLVRYYHCALLEMRSFWMPQNFASLCWCCLTRNALHHFLLCVSPILPQFTCHLLQLCLAKYNILGKTSWSSLYRQKSDISRLYSRLEGLMSQLWPQVLRTFESVIIIYMWALNMIGKAYDIGRALNPKFMNETDRSLIHNSQHPLLVQHACSWIWIR